MTTLLGSEKTEEQKKVIRNNTQNWERAEIVCNNTISAYKNGEIRHFKDAISYIVNSYAPVENDLIFINNEETETFKLYSEFEQLSHIKKLLKTPAGIRSINSARGVPSWIKEMALELIKYARKNGYKIVTPDHENSAFIKAEEIFKNVGINLNATALKSLYSNTHKKKKS